MPIVKAVQVPHGSEVLDPSVYPNSDYEGFQKLQKAYFEVAKQVFEAQPELIFLITPHGLELSRSHCIYTNSKGQGNVDNSEEYKKYTASVDIDYKKSVELLKIFNTQTSVPVEGLTAHDPQDNSIELKWAEVIPIWFLNSTLSFLKKQPKYMFFSLTSRRYQEDYKMVGEMLEVGSTLFDYFESLEERVVIVISADLAHSHLITHGPCKGQQPYPVSKNAEPFDQKIAKWAADPLNEQTIIELLVEDAKILDQALSCGYLGLVVLSAVFSKYEAKCRQYVSFEKAKSCIKSKLLECLHPTYFGMALAVFDFIKLQ